MIVPVFYLGKYENQTPHKQIEEVKDIKILPFKEALDILTFDSMKQILIEANNYLDR